MCPSCESLLGSTERQFNQKIFRPLVEDRLEHIKYDSWLLKFCVSLSWRVLCWFQDEDQFDDYSEEDRTLLDQATITWKKYLLGHSADISGTFRQHLYVVCGVSSAKHEIVPNLNLYVLRHINADIVRFRDQHIVYIKLPRIFIMGTLRDECPDQWQGTEIYAEGGTIPHVQRVPDVLYDYVNNKAERSSVLSGSISERQKAKVEADFYSDPVRVGESDTLNALRRDIFLSCRRDKNPESF